MINEDGGPARVADQHEGLPPDILEQLLPPGVVVTPPAYDPSTAVYEAAASGAEAPVPYEKQDRTPDALQHLEAMLGDLLALDIQKLVILRGAILDSGSVGLFAELRERGGYDRRLYRVATYDGRNGKFTQASRIELDDAAHLYDQRTKELA